ncbi:MAG: 16S rRNA (adenine(1518)-N(6)/adenine(1519)-N(6))-dimethyltransferase RsmA, partial [Patescibacteria group bacterium]
MKAKKSLGQNFLTSLAVVGDIVRAAKVTGGDVVVEVGPGKGILTAALLKYARRVIAVEKDDRLIPYLEEKFKEEIKNKNLTLIHGDILKLKIESLKLKTGSYKVVANIPYYITGQLLRFFLEHKNKPSSITILVQKEVGQRIVARDGKESILSISVKLFGEPRYVRKVSASVFSPKPKVDSAILNIENIRPPFKTKAEEGRFFKILKTG